MRLQDIPKITDLAAKLAEFEKFEESMYLAIGDQIFLSYSYKGRSSYNHDSDMISLRPMSRLVVRPLIQEEIDKIKAEMRALGVVFPDDPAPAPVLLDLVALIQPCSDDDIPL